MNERERLAVLALLSGMQGILNVLTGALQDKNEEPLNHGEHRENTEGEGQDNGTGKDEEKKGEEES